jgi:tRNA pseudouridine32 synthase / 23S rRNA pseudouridine746 synthase
VRLRKQLNLPDLAPMHRIDRETAGLVAFTKQPDMRGAYQALFESRTVQKTYQAIARWRADLSWPLTAMHEIVPAAHFMQMRTAESVMGGGAPNAVCAIDVIEHTDVLARYRLTPTTGRKHQLRVQMAALDMPILHDQIYPVLIDSPHEEPARALQLLAHSLAFIDPINGQSRAFTTQQSLMRLDQ